MTNKEKQILKNRIYEIRVAELIYDRMSDSDATQLNRIQTGAQTDVLAWLAGDLGLNEIITSAYREAHEYVKTN